jgi:cytochrome b561
MALLNSAAGYGALTKLLHWAIALLFLLQYGCAAVMLRTPDGDAAGAVVSQATLYNWHKSIGLVALVVAVLRLINRRAGSLPPWAPTITPVEKIIIHRAEQVLYGAMLVMPLTGFIYVMAGGYGVRLFGVFDLPNPMPEWSAVARSARWLHVASAYLLLLPLGAHLGIVLAHHLGLRDGLLRRMLPRAGRAR